MLLVTGRDRERLEELCSLFGVETSFHDVDGRVREASESALVATLGALGAGLDSPGDAGDALHARRDALERRVIEPVTVAWDGSPPLLAMNVPVSHHGANVSFSLRLEDGGVVEAAGHVEDLPHQGGGGNGDARRVLRLPPVPHGYHRLQVELGRMRHEALVIAAPTRCFDPDPQEKRRWWGLFAPTYALRTRRGGGLGDLADLRTLFDRCAELGGATVATLPLLPSFAGRPHDPSPYSPISRLFWSELYVPVESIDPGSGVTTGTDELVDYPTEVAARRELLERAAHAFFSGGDVLRDEYESWLRGRPHAEAYAAFRARVDATGRTWREWADPSVDAVRGANSEERRCARTHLYAAWLAEVTLDGVARRAARHGPGLHLDLPLGTHPGGFDTWLERDLFANGARVGAPPDTFFGGGQNWGFPPLHPGRLREQGYRHLVEVLRHHARTAGILRLDHVMSLYRLYWIPNGFPATSGVYVRYPIDELCAVASLESHRGRCMVVGEDLGTVPDEVRRAMRTHGLLRTHVFQLGLRADEEHALPQPAEGEVASLNTHDTPTFAGFLAGRDIDERVALGLADAGAERRERSARERIRGALTSALLPGGGGGSDDLALLAAALRHLARSPARLVLVNLEDLALETEPQNVPGTGLARDNWRRRMRVALEDLLGDPSVRALLLSLAR
ncbi:MAG: 4-alpha-glucanotransferase [Acidobacteriota bacterium]|nr:4-alpha-glucanotransferase [Acidobacteriota bacterium]